MAMFFTVVIVSLIYTFPPELAVSLNKCRATGAYSAHECAAPTSALFAAFLGYNPVNAILSAIPAAVITSISPSIITVLTGSTWFPTTLGLAFMPSLRVSFYIGAVLSLIAGLLSLMAGARIVQKPDTN